MASAAGLPCDIDPALCTALRSQKTGKCCFSIAVVKLIVVALSEWNELIVALCLSVLLIICYSQFMSFSNY